MTAMTAMATAAHELRVLDGLHAGARAALPGAGDATGRARLAIGSALDNDIVLSDPGVDARHALLLWDPQAGRWHLLADESAVPGAGHLPGEAVLLGPVRVTVAAANDRFELQPGPAEPEPALVDEPLPPADTDVADAPLLPPPARRRGLAWALLLGLAGLAALGAGWLWRGPAGDAGGPGAGSALRPVPQPARSDAAREAVLAVLAAQGLQGRLAVQGPPGKPQVSGVLPDPVALESLAQALMRLQPRPGLQVWTPDQVQAALRDNGQRWPAALRLGVDDSGALRLSGPLASEAAAVDLQQRLQGVLPAGVRVRTAFELPPQLAARALADARAQGFQVEGRLDDQPGGRRLLLTVELPEADRAERDRWERWLAGLPRQMGGVLPFAATVRAPASAGPLRVAPRNDPGLPFAVSSVVGGASPYLVLGNGTRLLPGGRQGDVTLLQIDDDGLLLQRGGQIFKVPR